ncbi:nucleoside hydrolase [Strigomonas culicis]|uniref:Nucleoside hydrolase n=1 Tax=Strigomonas culicis TaxID=28005 RepID=S9UBI2_9TRYP|nr:nucleoside hydrolase [Strigomonas culicis]EPY28220.1 nucleoside hydrolase [Strigomonas culicis]EPY31775.1 nucleoside hydrolase [Strigomonas culicis]|eukprot:EPY28132.1 nucleoside hydrolase [Strigomonas culicis]
MLKRKIIIDTDCGGDDAIAIMTALTDENTQVIAITAVWGNVDVDQGVQNLGKLLDLYGRDIPFFKGAAGPLVGTRETVQWGGFGKDGFGDADFPPSARVDVQPRTHAALAIIDLLRGAQPAEDEVYQLVCLGPLTNVALAMRIAPEVFSVLGSESEPAITIMGGASEAKGNSNLAAEFNIHCDPEAAHIVFHQREMKPIQLVTWEVTVDCCMTWHFYDTWVGRRSAQPQNATQAFVERMFQRLEAFTRPLEDGTKADTGDAEATQDATCVIPDAVAMVAALYPDSVLESLLTYSTVELYGRETRGETCIDWYGTDQSMAKRGRWRNCKLVSSIDNCKYLDVMEKIVNYTIEDI